MQQPCEYRIEYLVVKDAPYRNQEPGAKGTHPGEGVFHEGRVVWLATPLAEGASGDVKAYADGAGLVLVDSGCLKPA